ncbi:UDP-N-acetylglucosamine 2-epimerase (non-hydrolyzing) [Bradyrhizobium sp. INPA01-394B]|uniref:UDP-N-acetylglucosamine 2-epimerase (Non-hydrolyzing) n=1 Tax=Bradyrhizobium campsiandrae TaxID=1729892 RepID=A0ABR7U8U3_9BRAD|nr:UDP-N-acetylglucosamine 2-epimerase (non-hydrolyzing) [Bradyrhizobium campsiandrae]MBC9877525.1 UDP-N-acetylglucosamine 2-epimerase (non-hydrolyzing) [Bradyrhizobium campsiandrae]MBC9980479.1 UDP-N-acetylglucosamine 2-epimerase (non-hydrolyzing) [Bradyrhizobium campsiandrae]
MSGKILTVVGARPQFIKAAAVSRAIRETDGLTEVMIHTGQHFDPNMSDLFFEELAIPKPKHHLDVNGGGHGDMTGRMLMAIEPILLAERPDWVVVYGDTNSTLAGSLTAAKLHIPLAHVEAGLRSFNRRMPEEINRVVTDHLSTLHLCPTATAIANLAAEGVVKGVHHVGDVMYDATLFAMDKAETASNILTDLRLQPKRYALATVHRAENTDDPQQLREVVQFLLDHARDYPVVLPLHPRTRHAASRMGVSLDGLRVIEPIGYLDMAKLLHYAAEVYTDSGGLQKEAYFHRVPCITLRDETEWTETVANGWNRLWKGPAYLARNEITDYGSGRAAIKIAELLKH